MAKFLTLFKIQLKSAFNLSGYFRSVKADKKQIRKLLLAVVIILALAPTYWLYNQFIQILFVNLSIVNQQGAVLAMGVTGTSLVILFFGFMYIFSAFFGAKDLDMLLSMPIKPKYIVASKLSGIIVSEYLFAVPLMAPVFINYGLNISAGILYWIYALALTVFVPVIPLSIAAILGVLAVRAFGMRVNVERIQTVFMLLFMVVVLGLNFFITSTAASIPSGSEQQVIADLISNNRYLIDSMSAYYPPAKFAAESALNYFSFGGFVNLLIYLALSVLAFIGAVFVGNKVYISAVTRGLGRTNKSRRKRTSDQLEQDMGRVSSKAISIFKNDFRILLRTPIFAFNTLLVIPLIPVIIFFSISALQDAELNALRALYAGNSGAIDIFFCVGMILITSLTSITSSTFSREGSAFWINQIIPVSAKDQLIGRCMGAVMINIALIAAITGTFAYIVHPDVISIILIFIISVIASLPLTVATLLIDLYHPYLNWTDPAAAVKRNVNILFGMLAALLLSAVAGGLAYLMIVLHLNQYLILAIIALLSGILASVLSKVFIKSMHKAMLFN